MDVATTPTFLASQYGLHGRAQLDGSEGKGEMSQDDDIVELAQASAWCVLRLQMSFNDANRRKATSPSLRQAISSGGRRPMTSCAAVCCIVCERQPVHLVPASPAWITNQLGLRGTASIKVLQHCLPL